jgi:hypothetical protein
LWRETCVFGCLSYFVSLVVVVVVCCIFLLGFFFLSVAYVFFFPLIVGFFFCLLLVELQAHSPTPSPSINRVCILEEDLRILVSSKKKT